MVIATFVGIQRVVLVRPRVMVAEATALMSAAVVPSAATLQVVQLSEPLGHFLVIFSQQGHQLLRDRAVALASLFAGNEEGRRKTRLARTTRTTDTMDVTIEIVRRNGHIELNHVRHLGHIQTSRCHIGGNENANIAVTEHAQGVFALRLRTVTVDLFRSNTVHRAQAVTQPGGGLFLLHKNEGSSIRVTQRLDQQLHLLVRIGRGQHQLLANVIHGRAHTTHRNPHIVSQEVTSQLLDFGRECRREHERLAQIAAGHVVVLHDLSDLRLQDRGDTILMKRTAVFSLSETLYLKAHIKHAICLVQHQKRHLRQGNASAVNEVVEASGCGHDDVTATGQLLQLCTNIVSAIHTNALELRSEGQTASIQLDLRGKFSRWREHNSARQSSAMGVDANYGRALHAFDLSNKCMVQLRDNWN